MNELSEPNTSPNSDTGTEMSADTGSRKPVILQVLPALNTGGVERGTVDIAGAIAAEGWTSIVASAGGPMVNELDRVGVEHVTLPLDSKNPMRIYRNIGELSDLIDKRGIDLLHARSRAPAWSAMTAAKRMGRHFVTTYHGTYNAQNFLKRRYNSVMARGERVIAISDFIRNHVAERYRVEDSHLKTIYRGIDVDVFDPDAVSAERIIQLANAWRLPDGMPVIILPGRLTRWKGQAILIDALAALGRDDVRCLLVGSDQGRSNYRRELARAIESHGLSHIVHIVDNCRDMPAAYMLADVVISASTDPEAFGRVAAEAQAMGRPVVATDHGGARETVLAGETGWLVPAGDPKALADAINQALSIDETARKKIAVSGRAQVLSHFTVAAMRAKTLDVYREVLAAH